MPKGIPGSGPKYTNANGPARVETTPARIEPTPTQAAVVETTTADSIKHVIESLGFNVVDIAKVEISLQHLDSSARIRLLGVDRSLHSRRVDTAWEAAE